VEMILYWVEDFSTHVDLAGLNQCLGGGNPRQNNQSSGRFHVQGTGSPSRVTISPKDSSLMLISGGIPHSSGRFLVNELVIRFCCA
jgi:hypothetical protein